MARPKHRTQAAATYFVTTSTRQHMPLLQHPATATIVEQAIFRYRDQGHFLVHRHVVMPDHFHAILTPSATTSLEKSMQLIKGGSSYDAGKKLEKKLPLWQAGFTEHQIRDQRDFDTHVTYIDENPVKARIVEQPSEYQWCSARSIYRLDDWPQASAAKAGADVVDDSAELKLRPSQRAKV